jgi:hypothetical protein
MEDLGVRIGTPEDVDKCMNLALAACEDNGFVVPNPVRLLNEIWAALNKDHGLIGIIDGENGIAEGAVLLRITTPWYSDTQMIEERGVFVAKEFRSAKGGRARRLCEFSKSTADALGIPLLIGVLSNHRTAGKIRMYERIFGQPNGAFFLYGAHTGMPHLESE